MIYYPFSLLDPGRQGFCNVNQILPADTMHDRCWGDKKYYYQKAKERYYETDNTPFHFGEFTGRLLLGAATTD